MTLPIAFVLLQEPAAPDLSALLDAMRQHHPERSWTEGLPSPSRPRSPFILCGKRIVVLMPVAVPLPDDEEMWARAGDGLARGARGCRAPSRACHRLADGRERRQD
jgi:hypothetical protein